MSRRRTRHHHEVEEDRLHPDGRHSRFPRRTPASSSSASASSLASARRMSCRRMTCLSSRLFFLVSCLVLLISWSWESVSAQESASHPLHSSHGRTKGTVDPRVITYPGTTLDPFLISSPFHQEKRNERLMHHLRHSHSLSHQFCLFFFFCPTNGRKTRLSHPHKTTQRLGDLMMTGRHSLVSAGDVNFALIIDAHENINRRPSRYRSFLSLHHTFYEPYMRHTFSLSY